MADDIQYTLKKDGEHCHRRSGDPESGWIVVDYFDVVVHIFLAQTREYYAIEELWGDSATKEPVKEAAPRKKTRKAAQAPARTRNTRQIASKIISVS